MASCPEDNWKNPSDDTIKGILKNTSTVAVVGLSSRPDRPSYNVARYLLNRGYKIIPVNPKETEVLGQKAYPNLTAIGSRVDLVDIFRRGEETPTIVKEAIQIGAKYIWLQDGIVSQEAYDLATDAHLTIIMDKCILREHSRIGE